MLKPEKLSQVIKSIEGLNREEIIWLSGYLAGFAKSGQDLLPEAESSNTALQAKVTITYGTETGNSKKLANQLAALFKKHKVQAKAIGLERYKISELAKEEYFFTIMSTHGDGEPPEAAKSFYENLMMETKSIGHIKFSVLALGDSAYPLFCKAGADIDEQLLKLGANKIIPRKDCDVDYENDAALWMEQVINKVLETASTAESIAVAVKPEKLKTRQSIKGVVTANINLNDVGSKKETYHIEIAADELNYRPGDALGLMPHNDKVLVERLLGELKATGYEEVLFRNNSATLHEVLLKKLSIVNLPKRVVERYAKAEKIPMQLQSDYDLLELLQIFPPRELRNNLQQFVDLLEPIAPRLYSITSSPTAHNGEVHLLVAKNTFIKNDETRYGLCSNYLAQMNAGREFDFYIQANNNFRLPENDATDIIMIGPGTGVAPFRSFVAERDARGASGRNWLFFGEQHQRTDFLYQTEWQDFLETGALTKLSLAFSRDGDKKVYVQHRLLQHADEVFEWMEGGAHIYICGAKTPMSVDVENTLLQIISQKGKMEETSARNYLERLSDEGRYQKDVY